MARGPAAGAQAAAGIGAAGNLSRGRASRARSGGGAASLRHWGGETEGVSRRSVCPVLSRNGGTYPRATVLSRRWAMAAPVMGGAGLGAPSRAEIPLPPGPPGRGRTVGHERAGAAAPRIIKCIW